MTRRHSRMGYFSAAAGLLALGALVPAPPARADGIDDVIDQALAPIMDAAAVPDLHTVAEDWINSDLGKQVDGVINTMFDSYVIGNGVVGTAAHPDGTPGGWLIGDGGNGWNSTEAGIGGGDGGNGGWLIGDGGNGGNAGDGAGADSLPALGGAGGNAGVFGVHGAVGDYGTVPDSGPVSPSAVEVTGNWLTDSDGRVVVLHGLNEVYKIPPYEPSASGFSDDDAAFLEANGFNAVRLGVIWAGVEPQPGVIDYAYLASIEQTVQILAAHHIHVILDMHQDLYSNTFQGEGAPAWATQTGDLPNPDRGFPGNYFLNPAENHAWDAFWANADGPNGVGLENSYAQMWEAVAAYFKGNTDIAGYEIMNEPWAGSQALPSLFGSSHFGAQELTPFYNQVDSAIRAVDPNTPVFFEPNVLSSYGSPTHLGTVDDPNSVFAFHGYCPMTAVAGSSFGCGLYDDLVIGQAETYATAHGIPTFMTEFGATDNLTTLGDMTQAANSHQVGWTEWAFTGHDITSSSPNGQALVYNPQLPPTGDNVDTAKLAVLAEPSPQVVAGTPNSWSFENGTFQLSYSTERADGSGDFAAGSQTTISVPAIEYPNGYHVEVTGGHVVSAANAPELVIASNAGASTVSVAVSAAGAA